MTIRTAELRPQVPRQYGYVRRWEPFPVPPPPTAVPEPVRYEGPGAPDQPAGRHGEPVPERREGNASKATTVTVLATLFVSTIITCWLTGKAVLEAVLRLLN